MMNIAVILALASAVFNAGNDLVYRKASIISRKTGTMSFFLMASAAAAIIALILNIIKSGGFAGLIFGMPDLLYGSILGIVSFITYILYLASFSGENTSVSVTIFRMNLVPTILLAVIFMGESISLRRGIAIVCCIISLLMLSSWKSGKFPDKHFLLPSLGAFLAGAVLNVVNKAAAIHGTHSFSLLSVRFLVVTILAGLIVLFKKSFIFDKKAVKYAVSSGFFLVIAIFLTLEALKTGDVGLVLPINQLSFTLIIVISWLFFKEKMNIKKIFGVLLAIGSIFLMN